MLFKKKKRCINQTSEHFEEKKEVDVKEDQLESQKKEKNSRFHIIIEYLLEKYNSHPEYDKKIYLDLFSEILDDYTSDSGIILDEIYIHYKKKYIDLIIKKNLLIDCEKKLEASLNTVVLLTPENLEKKRDIRNRIEARSHDNELFTVINQIECIIGYFEEKYGPLSYNQKNE